MLRVVIEKKICLEPFKLDEKIGEHIMEKINKDFLNSCDIEHGYIIKIYKKFNILENSVSSAGLGVFFRVKFLAKVIKPELKSEYEGIVKMVFQTGIFIDVVERMKVFIPEDKLVGYKYDKSQSIFKKGDKKIAQNDKISVIIDMIKYEKQNFNCIGSLKKT